MKNEAANIRRHETIYIYIHKSPNERMNELTHERNVTELLLANDVLICVWNCIELGILGYNLTISRSYLLCMHVKFVC